MMTREEAITLLKYRRNIISSVDVDWNANEIEAINLALSALRPVSREQVEKVWRGCKHCTGKKVPFCYDGANDSVYLLTGNGLAAIESDSWGFLVSYCPNCGRPLTDEAVQMVIERMEALKDGSTTD